jgi:Ca2+-transporting ATPase
MKWVGLRQRIANERLMTEGENTLPVEESRSPLKILLKVLSEPMFLLLVAAGILYLILGNRTEALFLLSFIVVVIGITLFQERKTENALEALRDLSSPRALVIRDGVARRVPGKEIVREDILILSEGDLIAGDAILREGRIEVDESILTGESVAVVKSPTPVAAVPGNGPSRENLVFAGTVITRGQGIAEVVKTGPQTDIGRIGLSLSHISFEKSPLQKSSEKLVRNLSLVGGVLAVSDFMLNWLWGKKVLLESILGGLALAMAILPEEIPVILTMFLMIGAWRLSKIQVLTRHIPVVESLGSITVLAVDKTGTLTENRMVVKELFTIEGVYENGGNNSDLPETFHILLEFAILASLPVPFDPMEKAIQDFGHQSLSGTEHLHEEWKAVKIYDLAPPLLAMTRVFHSEEPDRRLLAAKGSPEAVMDLCHLPESKIGILAKHLENMARKGLRVLGVARGEWLDGSALPENQHDLTYEFLGFIGLYDPPRKDVTQAIKECHTAGIRLIMMTGDHPETARSIGREIGLASPNEVISGHDIESFGPGELGERLSRINICARLLPEHKLRIVKTLIENGEIVGVTGDGVNDAPALRAAHVGIAMGERGTDVARKAASLVLLNDSFASIVNAIRLGRQIYTNISAATRFALSAHFPFVGLTIFPAMLKWPLLILPVHIVLLQLVIDPACSLVFESENTGLDLMKMKPRPPQEVPFTVNHMKYSILQGLISLLLLFCGVLWMHSMGWTIEKIRSALFLCIIFNVLGLILSNLENPLGSLNIRSSTNPLVLRLFSLVILFLIPLYSVPFLKSLMGWGKITSKQIPSVLLVAGTLVFLMGIALWRARIAERKFVRSS